MAAHHRRAAADLGERALLAAIDCAREQVRLGYGCFAPTRRLAQALAAAAERGIDVRRDAPV